MKTYEVCCTATLEIYVTVEAENEDEAVDAAGSIDIIDYANNTVGAEANECLHPCEINQVLGHEVDHIVSIKEVGDGNNA
tara:strand:- start:183 stop:422 length:240 start_codon:yes stop_codon:yes gene_type:complete